MDKSEPRERQKYIDGLKGIACIMIMVGHYLGIVKFTSGMPGYSLGIVKSIAQSNWGLIVDESLWLRLFFVISGYLIAMSRITDIKQLEKKVFKRFFRLYLPVLGACIFIYAIYIFWGFHNEETKIVFTNTWFQNYYYNYAFTLKDILVEPIRIVLGGGEIYFNAPYWCISSMFYASVIIYVGNWMMHFLSNPIVKFIISVAVTFIAKLLLGEIGFACCIGMISRKIVETDFSFWKNKYISNVVTIGITLLALGLHNTIYDTIIRIFHTAPSILEFSEQWSIIYFAILIIAINYNKYAKRFLTQKLFLKLNNISFGIYSFHWPIVCSIGATLILMIKGNMGVVVCWCVSGILTFLLATLYNFTVEKVAFKWINRI